MKVLIVAMQNSIHTVRWLSQIHQDRQFELFLFPINQSPVHAELQRMNVKVLNSFPLDFFSKLGIGGYTNGIINFLTERLKNIFSYSEEKSLLNKLKKLKPDVVHSLETQHAGYLVLSALVKRPQLSQEFVWWHTNWGSDIYLFQHFQLHREKIKKLLSLCQVYSCECDRDVILAREFGFIGDIRPVYPNSGGFHLAQIAKIREDSVPTSQRNIIMIKGYQGWAGRALVGLRVIRRTMDLLDGYKIVIYTSTGAQDIQIAAGLLRSETGLDVELIPETASHKEILQLHAKARVSIALSISDGISTSMLEAMSVGSFPIQSNTSGAEDWITSGKSGFIVPPEDPEVIEAKLREALTNNALVDNASDFNWDTICRKADFEILKKETIKSYHACIKLKNKRRNELYI